VVGGNPGTPDIIGVKKTVEWFGKKVSIKNTIGVLYKKYQAFKTKTGINTGAF